MNTNNGFCYFGSYDSNYSRNRIIIKGLKANSIKIFECHSTGILFKRYLNLILQFWKIKSKVKVIIVGFPGHYDVLLAFILGKILRKKIYFDIFASLYETYVIDRKIYNRKSFSALIFYVIDWINLRLSDKIIGDTRTHLAFYSKLYYWKGNNGIVIYVGSDNDFFYPKKLKDLTDVLFYGSYQPLQGVLEIAKAAKQIPNVKFKFIGSGLTKTYVLDFIEKYGMKNIEMVDWISLHLLAEEINKAKIVLGIFGSSQKAYSVIPNKVYDGISCRKAIISKETPAIKEQFTNQKNCILVKTNKDLAKAITYLLKNPKTRNKIAKEGYEIYKNSLTPIMITKPILA